MLAGQIIPGIPTRSVEKLSLKPIESRDVGPPPRIQETTSIDKDVAMIRKGMAILQHNIHFPFACVLFPHSFGDLVTKLAEAAEIVFVTEVAEILEDVCRTRVNGWELWVRFERPGI